MLLQTPFAILGFQPYVTGGDVITKLDGKQVTTDEALQNAVSARKPGTQITLTVVRGGSERTVHVTLGRRPS